ncbi:MAG: nucleotide sugar dehydrogenase, partial [Phototrophicales bacterium]
GPYDAVVVAVDHEPYLELDEEYFRSLVSEPGVLVDIKGLYRNKIQKLSYWSL